MAIDMILWTFLILSIGTMIAVSGKTVIVWQLESRLSHCCFPTPMSATGIYISICAMYLSILAMLFLSLGYGRKAFRFYSILLVLSIKVVFLVDLLVVDISLEHLTISTLLYSAIAICTIILYYALVTHDLKGNELVRKIHERIKVRFK